jgi:hypothetical protein
MLRQPDSDLVNRFTWGVILTLVTVVSTLAVACGTPFVALATLGALFLPRRDAFTLIGINWLANQAIGFAWLHYPHTLDCYVGGAALGVAAALCALAAVFASSRLRKAGAVLQSIGSFTAAFATYEGVLFALSPPDSMKDFALPIVVYIFWVNAIAFVGLLLIKSLASALGLAFPIAKSRPVLASADPR